MKKITAWLLFCLVFCAAPVQAEDRPYVVLALSGGGIKGYAHIGVLDILEKNGIGVAGIVGTSMGAAIGGMYASGYTAEEIEKIVDSINLGELIASTGQPFFNISERVQRDVSLLRPEIYTDAKNRAAGPLGLFAGAGVLECFARHLSHITVTDFNKLPIPFAAVATDLVTGEKVVIRHGSLASAIRASISLPGVFDPWNLNGRLLVDGGLVSNMPVETAKNLFPGYPVIAVNLTSELGKRSSMGNMVDVLMQSITILTMQNVRREATLADLVISPSVKEYPILGDTKADVIVEQGRAAALKSMPQIRALLKRAPVRKVPDEKPAEPQELPRVAGVRVIGAPAEMARGIEKELNRAWLGRPVSMKSIIEAGASITRREDVRNVDYDLVETKRGVIVEMNLQRFPAHRYSLSGYGSTFSGAGWLTVNAKSYDYLKPGDLLQARLYLSDSWAGVVNYYWGMDNPSNSWELEFLASRYSLNTPGGFLKWDRYAAALSRRVTVKDRLWFEGGLNVTAMRNVHGADEVNFAAPYVLASLNMMNAPEDPTDGMILHVGAAWPTEAEELMLYADLTARKKLGPRLLAEVRGGYREGDMSSSPLFAAYLGAREELYSLANRPILSEDFLWWRAKLAYSLKESFLGSSVVEIFGGQGYAWNGNGDRIAEPWEVGLAFCAPRKLLDARVYALYTNQSEWRFGVTLGMPDLDVFLPF